MVFLVDLFFRRTRIDIRWPLYGLSLLWIVLLAVKGAQMTPMATLKAMSPEIRPLKEQLAKHFEGTDAFCTEWYFSYVGEAIVGQTDHPLLMHPDHAIASPT